MSSFYIAHWVTAHFHRLLEPPLALKPMSVTPAQSLIAPLPLTPDFRLAPLRFPLRSCVLSVRIVQAELA